MHVVMPLTGAAGALADRGLQTVSVNIMPELLEDGTLELNEKGFGFLRSARRNYAIHPGDPYVSPDRPR